MTYALPVPAFALACQRLRRVVLLRLVFLSLFVAQAGTASAAESPASTKAGQQLQARAKVMVQRAADSASRLDFSGTYVHQHAKGLYSAKVMRGLSPEGGRPLLMHLTDLPGARLGLAPRCVPTFPTKSRFAFIRAPLFASISHTPLSTTLLV